MAREPKWRCDRCGRFVEECSLFHLDDAGRINVCARCAVEADPAAPSEQAAAGLTPDAPPDYHEEDYLPGNRAPWRKDGDDGR